MKFKSKDIAGQKFGMLTAIEPVEKSRNGTLKWKCECDCGTETVVFGSALRSGTTSSCGCAKSQTISRKLTRHGKRNSPTYLSWRSMKARCTNKNDPFYADYGGRGIKVCDRWLRSFENFLEDMGDRPEGMSLDRIDFNGGYEPENCRWATDLEQARNRRTTINVTFEGEVMSRKAFSRLIGVSDMAVRAHFLKGETPEQVASWFKAKRGGLSTIEGALVE